MSEQKISHLQEPHEHWGGPWTEKKLNAFSKYVNAYLTILKAYPHWQTIYFDGFAGSGSRKDPKTSLYNQLQITLEEEEGYKGAAERVVRLKKSFDYYYFVDNQDGIEKLQAKLTSLPEAEGKELLFRQEDCNLELKKLATAMRSNEYAALVLLDPFGMQINWDAIANLKNTRSDIWILLPTGVIVNRLLDKAGKLKSIALLESFFGLTEEVIRKEFYRTEQQLTLFGEDEITRKISDPIHHIANMYIQQLKTVWKYVTDEPLILPNSRNVPIYHFVFASNNAAAKNIAKDIIKRI